MGNLVFEQALHHADEITYGAALALLFHKVGRATHHLIQTRSRSVEEETDFRVAIVIIGEFTDVMDKCMSRFDDFGHLIIFQRNVKGTPPVVARPNRASRHGDFSGRHHVLGKNAVDDFIVGAVAAHRDKLAVAFFNNGIAYNFNGVSRIFGHHIIEVNTLINKHLLNHRPVFS